MHLTRQALCRRATDRLVLTQPGHETCVGVAKPCLFLYTLDNIKSFVFLELELWNLSNEFKIELR